MPLEKILVTGGTGFIGRSVVSSLVKSGKRVRVLDNGSRGAIESLGEISSDVEILVGDIRDSETVLKACASVDQVIHLAYINGTEYFYSRPYEILEVGIKGTLNILDAHKKTKFESLVLASSSEAYQTPQLIPTPEDVELKVPDVENPRFSYGGGKIASELLVVNYAKSNDLDIKVFRPHNVYGPNMGEEHVIPQLIRKIERLKINESRSKELKIQGDGNQSRAFCYIDDFTAGLRLVLDAQTKEIIFNIGVQDETSIAQLASRISEKMGIPNVSLSPSELPSGSTSRRCPDISRLRALGFKPQINLDEGLSRTIAWYQSN